MADRTNLAEALPHLSDEELRALIYHDLASFVQAMFGLDDPEGLKWAPYLSLLCAKLQDVAEGRCRRLIITMPPRHLKSFAASVALPAFFLGHHPNKKVMCVSYAQELANDFARQTLKVMQSPLYRETFGEVLAPGRHPLHLLRTAQGGSRRATSIDGTATGVGADLLIFDDPQKPGETLSDAIRRATNTAYENTFVTRGSGQDRCIVIVMQRLHEDDFVGHVLERPGDWQVINFPAIAEEDEAVLYQDPLSGPKLYRRMKGEALSSQWPLSELESLRESLGEAAWASQFQQRPAPAGGGLVKIDRFKRFDLNDPPPFDRIYQSWDTANTTSQWSAWSVCTTWGVVGKTIYLLHVLRRKMEYPQLKAMVVEQARIWTPETILIEEHQSGVQILQELRQENFGKLRAVKPKGDKQVRMINQTALIENGRVYIPTEAPWLPDYLHELAVFPNGKFADQVDSTSQALDALNIPTGWDKMQVFMDDERRSRGRPPFGVEEETWIMQGPPECREAYDIEGVGHRRLDDGFFHLKRSHAVSQMSHLGWKRIS